MLETSMYTFMEFSRYISLSTHDNDFVTLLTGSFNYSYTYIQGVPGGM